MDASSLLWFGVVAVVVGAAAWLGTRAVFARRLADERAAAARREQERQQSTGQAISALQQQVERLERGLAAALNATAAQAAASESQARPATAGRQSGREAHLARAEAAFAAAEASSGRPPPGRDTAFADTEPMDIPPAG